MEKVETVRGPISPEDLGITLSHEHLLTDLKFSFLEPAEASERPHVNDKISLDNLAYVMRNPRSSKDNLTRSEVQLSANELRSYKRHGGKSVCEVTTIDMARDPEGLKSISEMTGVNIICATGWYTFQSHPKYVKQKPVDKLCSIMVQDLKEGIGPHRIKAGVIKCGCNFPLHPDERKVLEAAGQAQRETNAPLTIHPGAIYDGKLVDTVNPIIDILQKQDANLNKVYISHMDLFLFGGEKDWSLSLDYHTSIMDHYEVVLNFDTFGKNRYSAFPSIYIFDSKRVAAVAELCKQGYDKRLMLSHDNAYKVALERYGGPGYAHVLTNIIPELKYRDVTGKQVQNMLVENPKRMLAY